MASFKKILIVTLLLTTWITIFGYSLSPLSWGGHAINTIFPTRMLDLTESQAAFLDAEFEAFVNRTGEIDYYFPADWYTDPIIGPTIPYRIELKYLNLFFEEMFNIANAEETNLPFSYYNTASQVFEQEEYSRASLVVFVTSYLIHRSYDAWVYVASNKAWAEVYLTNDWRAEYTFGNGGRYYDREWMIKFNDSVQIYSIVSYVIKIIFTAITSLLIVFSISLLLIGFKNLKTSYYSLKKKNYKFSDIVRYYIATVYYFISYTIMLPLNFLKDVFVSMKEEIVLLFGHDRDSKRRIGKEAKEELEESVIPVTPRPIGTRFLVKVKQLGSPVFIAIFIISLIISALIAG
ncbi:MAG: hypothetical protein ACFFD4_31730, partial [Candidatus Odinarchaeota archaeon]